MTATDIVPAENIAALEALDDEAREKAITAALEQANSWLAHVDVATAKTEDIANFKAYIATVEDATRRLQASKDCQRHAQVVTRRAERTLGLSIRAGQERGEIGSRSHFTSSPSKPFTRTRLGRVEVVQPPVRDQEQQLKRPISYFSSNEDMSKTYAVTDGVTDEQFDEALERAESEENVSRANVVRKVHEVRSNFPSPTARWQRVQELAERGHTSAQIAREVGISEQGVRTGAKQRGLTIPADRVMGKRRRIDTNRILRETTTTLEGVVSSLALVNVDDIDDPEEAREWVDSLSQSLKALRRAVNQIKESIP